MPKISVIIPTYNRAETLIESLKSVLDQTHPAHQIIVVDDGSTDNSVSMLSPFRSRIDYIRQENAGVSAARNTGLAAATGDWIAFLDSDDVWYPNRLSVLVRDIRKNKKTGISTCD